MSDTQPRLPPGVSIRDLTAHPDDRGVFMEVYREEWGVGCAPVQWNAVHSRAGVLRGVHVHAVHADYLLLLAGTMVLGLHDLRPEDPRQRRCCLVRLDATTPRAVTIPPGVCHGFYFPVPSIHLYAVSDYWNLRDELGCRFDCPELGLDWPEPSPSLSRRDAEAGDYEEMRRRYLDADAEQTAAMAEVPS